MGRPVIYMENVKIENKHIIFSYSLNAPPTPDKEWWCIYKGAMPSYADGDDYLEYQYIADIDATSLNGHVNHMNEDLVDGCLYTIALYTNDKDYDLVDYREVIA